VAQLGIVAAILHRQAVAAISHRQAVAAISHRQAVAAILSANQNGGPSGGMNRLRKNPSNLSFRSRPAGEESRPERFQRSARFLVVRHPDWRTPRNDRPKAFFRSLMKPPSIKPRNQPPKGKKV
jgi:hypothetical protein